MASVSDKILGDVSAYYDAKLAEHGVSPAGVDWNGEASQMLRFEQLLHLIPSGAVVSVNDLGCGYGALYDYLSQQNVTCHYAGNDISPEMIRAAEQLWSEQDNVTFSVGPEPIAVADYAFASGIFNVRLGHSDQQWRQYIESTLDTLHKSSRIGFGFNCLTSYSDPEKMRDYLYYASPTDLFDLCKRKFSRHVALLHDYGLYEFTLLVRKSPS